MKIWEEREIRMKTENYEWDFMHNESELEEEYDDNCIEDSCEGFEDIE
jgi:hypothetical protein